MRLSSLVKASPERKKKKKKSFVDACPSTGSVNLVVLQSVPTVLLHPVPTPELQDLPHLTSAQAPLLKTAPPRPPPWDSRHLLALPATPTTLSKLLYLILATTNSSGKVFQALQRKADEVKEDSLSLPRSSPERPALGVAAQIQAYPSRHNETPSDRRPFEVGPWTQLCSYGHRAVQNPHGPNREKHERAKCSGVLAPRWSAGA